MAGCGSVGRARLRESFRIQPKSTRGVRKKARQRRGDFAGTWVEAGFAHAMRRWPRGRMVWLEAAERGEDAATAQELALEYGDEFVWGRRNKSAPTFDRARSDLLLRKLDGRGRASLKEARDAWGARGRCALAREWGEKAAKVWTRVYAQRFAAGDGLRLAALEADAWALAAGRQTWLRKNLCGRCGQLLDQSLAAKMRVCICASGIDGRSSCCSRKKSER